MKKLTIIASLTATLFTSASIAHDLGDHLPKKGQPTETQILNGGSTKVTKDNFILAESDKYFFEQQEKSGINQFTHDRQLLTMDTQTVVRQNRDTLYSKSIWDAEGGVTFELPIIDSYQTLQIIDEQHRTVAVLYAEKGKIGLPLRQRCSLLVSMFGSSHAPKLLPTPLLILRPEMQSKI